MPFIKGVRASPATEFKPGQSGNPDGRPSKNVWLRTGAHRTPPPELCQQARRRRFDETGFAQVNRFQIFTSDKVGAARGQGRQSSGLRK